nr:MAG TPA: hypothetical protein [Caudoviricetes sp.]
MLPEISAPFLKFNKASFLEEYLLFFCAKVEAPCLSSSSINCVNFSCVKNFQLQSS